MIPEPGPPTGEPGSGKFGTPCERMQSANSSASVSPLPVPTFPSTGGMFISAGPVLNPQSPAVKQVLAACGRP